MFTIIYADLDIPEEGVIPSEQRAFVYNRSYIVPVDLSSYPQTINVKLKNSGFYQSMKIGISVPMMGEALEPYTEIKVTRSSIYVYEPGTVVYLLVNTETQKIYVMQSYCTKTDSQINTTSLYTLSNQLVNMPPYFKYVILTVKENQCLIAVTTITSYPAVTLQDEFSNTYQLLYKEINPDLYSQFDLTNQR